MSTGTAPSDSTIDEAQAALAELHRRRKRNAEAQRRLRERKKRAKEAPSPQGGATSSSSGSVAPMTASTPSGMAAANAATPSEPEAWEVWSSVIFDEARTRAPSIQSQQGRTGSGFFAPGPVGLHPVSAMSVSSASGTMASPDALSHGAPSSTNSKAPKGPAPPSCEDILAMSVGTDVEERKALLNSHGEMSLFFSATPLRGLIENTRRLRMPLKILADMDAQSNVSESWLRWKEPKLASVGHPSPTNEASLHVKPAGCRSDGWVERTGDGFLARLRAIGPDDFMTWDDVPANMHPCHEQLVIAHHPYLDALFPLPEMRSRCLLGICTGEIEEDDICAMLLEQHTTVSRSVLTSIGTSPQQQSPQQATDTHPTASLRPFTYTLGPSPLRAPDGTVQPGWYLWSDDATDPDNWEFSEGFVRKFPTLLDHSILRRTNWWRAKRGLPPLSGDGIRR